MDFLVEFFEKVRLLLATLVAGHVALVCSRRMLLLLLKLVVVVCVGSRGRHGCVAGDMCVRDELCLRRCDERRWRRCGHELAGEVDLVE